MSQVAGEDATGVHVDFEIDPRSFHVFEFNGKEYFFDRATATTSELNEFAADVLRSTEKLGLGAALSDLALRYPEFDSASIVDVLRVMKDKGMFQFQPLDRQAQDAFIQSLWLHHPYRIQMLMAQGCNLGCRYCYAWRNGSNQKHTLMPFDIARRAVDYLVWRSGERSELLITFFGGEPLLNYPVIREVVEYCRKIEQAGRKQFTFELCTNCTLLDRDVTDFLVQEEFLLFMSIDGWREMHNYNRPSMEKDDLYDVIVSNAKYAFEQYRSHGLQVPKVRANLTNQFHNAREVGEYLESLGFTNIDVGMIEPLPHGDPSPAAVTEDQADELLLKHEESMKAALDAVASGKKLGRFLGKLFNGMVEMPHKLPTVGVTCGIGRNTLIVDNKGNLFPCHRYEGMEAYVLGNVFTGLDRQTTMSYYRRINAHATDHCDDCWIRDYCGGGCVWLLSTRQGHLADPTERECNRRRRGKEIALGMRAELRARLPEWFKDYQDGFREWSWDDRVCQNKAVGKKVSLTVLSGTGAACAL